MKRRSLSSLAAVGFAALFCGPDPALAQSAPPLGVFRQFGILAAQGVTANGTTVVAGDVGSYPTPSITGAGLSTVAPWTIHFAADAVVQQAQIDATAAYLNLAGQGGTVIPAGLGGTTLGPGVYTFASTADIGASTNFTLTGAGVYVFNVPTSLTANVLSTVTLNGVDPCQVFWRVGTAATLNGVNFPGTVIANAAVSFGNAMNLQGRAASLTAAVTLAATGQTIGGCSSAPASCPVITLAPPTLPAGAVGVAYSQQLTASGGTGPYAFTVSIGTLPAGLTLSSTGLLAGTPTTLGSSTVVIRATDASACPGVATYTIIVAPPGCPVITLAPPTLPAGAVGTAYSQQITASGGTGPYAFTVSSGTLPAGLTLSSAGLVAGTPTTLGSSPVVIRATDASACPGVATYTINIGAAVPTLPQAFLLLLALVLMGAGYFQLRRRARTA